MHKTGAAKLIYASCLCRNPARGGGDTRLHYTDYIYLDIISGDLEVNSDETFRLGHDQSFGDGGFIESKLCRSDFLETVCAVHMENSVFLYSHSSVGLITDTNGDSTSDANQAIHINKESSSSMDVSIPGERVTNIDKLLRDRDINYQVTGEQSKKIRCPTPVLRPTNVFSSNRAMDWKDFHQLTVIYNAMETLEAKYPSICTVSNIGKSVEGRDIKMLRITNSDTRNKAVWLDGGIHAREWIAVSVVAYIAHQFATHYSALPEYVTNKDWYFVPVVNPDGYHYTHTSDRLWRKNRARVENTPCGVDLNRNFGYGWGKTKNDAYEDPNHINYQGSEAFSEPETKAIRDVILNSNISFKIFLTFHAYSEVISFPWCNSTEPCPDYVDLLEGATVMAKAVYDTHKRVYKVGNFRNIMYYATGTSIDWSYGSAKIPFSYLFELRSKHHKFLLPKEEILPCCEEALSGVKALAKFVEQKKQYFSHSRLKM